MLHPVDVKTFTPEIFRVFEQQPPLLTAGDRETCNTMTIGWCQMGTIWNVPTCTVLVRPERYTYQFMENNDYFTVSILPKDMKSTVVLCGTKSGRDTDKIGACGLTLCYGAGDAPYFAEAEAVLVCKKMYVQDMDPACILEDAVITPFYGEKGGLHRLYVGQVQEVYMK